MGNTGNWLPVPEGQEAILPMLYFTNKQLHSERFLCLTPRQRVAWVTLDKTKFMEMI